MLFESFLKYIRYELNLSAYTVLSYSNDLKQLCEFLNPGSNDCDWASVTTNDIRAWVVDLASKGDSARTVRRKVQTTRAFYKFLMKRGVVSESPAADVELAKVPKRLPVYVRESSMNEILAEDEDSQEFGRVRDRLIILMLYSTGIRRGELVDLQDANVDTNMCEMKVHGKRNKDRIVPFGEELAVAIGNYREIRDREIGNYNFGSFFVRKNGEPLYPQLVYKVVHNHLAAAGVEPKCSPHVLRHTFASAMLNNGAQLNSVKEILGHESLATTQVYTHITFSELKSNYEHAHPRALKKGG